MICNVNEKLISLFSEIAQVEMVPLPRSSPIAAASDTPMALTRTGIAIRRSLFIGISNLEKSAIWKSGTPESFRGLQTTRCRFIRHRNSESVERTFNRVRGMPPEIDGHLTVGRSMCATVYTGTVSS